MRIKPWLHSYYAISSYERSKITNFINSFSFLKFCITKLFTNEFLIIALHVWKIYIVWGHSNNTRHTFFGLLVTPPLCMCHLVTLVQWQFSFPKIQAFSRIQTAHNRKLLFIRAKKVSRGTLVYPLPPQSFMTLSRHPPPPPLECHVLFESILTHNNICFYGRQLLIFNTMLDKWALQHSMADFLLGVPSSEVGQG